MPTEQHTPNGIRMQLANLQRNYDNILQLVKASEDNISTLEKRVVAAEATAIAWATVAAEEKANTTRAIATTTDPIEVALSAVGRLQKQDSQLHACQNDLQARNEQINCLLHQIDELQRQLSTLGSGLHQDDAVLNALLERINAVERGLKG